jgi:lipoyltransferase 1
LRDYSLTHAQQISGTAAKLGRPNAYHHCTLLVDVDKVKLGHALHKHHVSIMFPFSEYKFLYKIICEGAVK